MSECEGVKRNWRYSVHVLRKAICAVLCNFQATMQCIEGTREQIHFRKNPTTLILKIAFKFSTLFLELTRWDYLKRNLHSGALYALPCSLTFTKDILYYQYGILTIFSKKLCFRLCEARKHRRVSVTRLELGF